MPHLTRSLTGGEPIVQLTIGVSVARADALGQADRPVPPPVTLSALIDTGASVTAVHEPAIASLGLQVSGFSFIHTPSTAGVGKKCPKYDVGLALLDKPASFMIGSRPVVGTDLSGNGVEALIGCDILSSCLFIHDGAAQTFTLAF